MTPTPSTHPNFDASALPNAVEQLAASVVGLSMRRGAASGVVWQSGVVVTTASALWRAHRLQVVLPDGEPVAGDIRGRIYCPENGAGSAATLYVWNLAGTLIRTIPAGQGSVDVGVR